MKVTLSKHTITGAILGVLLALSVVFTFHPSASTLRHTIVSKVPKIQNEKLAYLIFLTSTVDQSDDLEHDNYFVATRILVWQLLHNPKTMTTRGVDVVVMVTPDVSEARRSRLVKDGAVVHPVEFLHTENDAWISPAEPRLVDMMTKLRAWNITQYDRILMLDNDMVLRSSLDGVFDDPGAQVQKTLPPSPSFKSIPNLAPLPSTYLLASLPEISDSNHEFPPANIEWPENFNGGFMMFAPSEVLFKHFCSLMDTKDAFEPTFMEQTLLNLVHRRHPKGPMPWRNVAFKWNVRYPNENDFEKGIVSVHEKWWAQPYIYDNQKVKDYLQAVRWEMKGWYESMENDVPPHRNAPIKS